MEKILLLLTLSCAFCTEVPNTKWKPKCKMQRATSYAIAAKNQESIFPGYIPIPWDGINSVETKYQ